MTHLSLHQLHQSQIWINLKAQVELFLFILDLNMKKFNQRMIFISFFDLLLLDFSINYSSSNKSFLL